MIIVTLVASIIVAAASPDPSSSSAGTTVSIGSTTSKTYDTVPIMISTDDVDGIGAVTIVLTYDTAIVSLSSVSGDALGDVTWNDVDGTVTMTAVHATACPTGSNIKFADLEFCPVVGSGTSNLDIEVTTLADCDENSITPDAVNDGKFIISGEQPTISTNNKADTLISTSADTAPDTTVPTSTKTKSNNISIFSTIIIIFLALLVRARSHK